MQWRTQTRTDGESELSPCMSSTWEIIITAQMCDPWWLEKHPAWDSSIILPTALWERWAAIVVPFEKWEPEAPRPTQLLQPGSSRAITSTGICLLTQPRTVSSSLLSRTGAVSPGWGLPGPGFPGTEIGSLTLEIHFMKSCHIIKAEDTWRHSFKVILKMASGLCVHVSIDCSQQPSAHEWMNGWIKNVGYIHTLEYYSAIRMNKVLMVHEVLQCGWISKTCPVRGARQKGSPV